MATEPVRIPRAEFGRRRGALSMDLEQRGLDGWIACGDERPFSGGDHVRWLSDFPAHFEPVAVAGRGAEALLLTGPESAGLAELDLAGTGLTEVLAARELSHPGLAYGSIDLAGGADALRALFAGARRIAVIGRESLGASALLDGLDLTMVGSGERSRTILARSSFRRPAPGDVVAVTVVPRYEGYVVCMARPFVLGQNPAAAAAIDAAWLAQERALEQLAPGAPGSRATEAARAAVASAATAAQVDEVWVHSSGTMEFEPPYFTPGSDATLEVDMAISIDVPLFFAPWGGLRIEDGFRLEADGPRPRVGGRREAFPWQL